MTVIGNFSVILYIQKDDFFLLILQLKIPWIDHGTITLRVGAGYPAILNNLVLKIPICIYWSDN